MKSRERIITPASWITIGRLALVPLILIVLLSERKDRELLAFGLFLAAALSDTLDGIVARRFNQVSALGKFLDPLADKLLIAPVLLLLLGRGQAPLGPSLVIIGREVVVTAWRWQALRQGRSFSASVTAKVKTDSQLVAISLLLAHPYLPWPEAARLLGIAALYFGALMALISALDYRPRSTALDKPAGSQKQVERSRS